MYKYKIDDLVNFVKDHADWKDLLKKPPYSLKSINQCAYNPDWYMFTYNLFDSDLTNNIVCVCRGSVLEIKENNGKRDVRVICEPYHKFFNYGDSNMAEIDWNSAIVEDKCDGQLIKCSKVNGQTYWFTNGSFDLGVPIDSECPEKGIHNYRHLVAYALRQESPDFVFGGLDNNGNNSIRFAAESEWTRKIPDEWTLMFELCSPYNKIQVQYDEIKLWFHGARDPNGLEHDPVDVAKEFGIPYEIPKRWDLHNIQETLDMLSTFKEDKEGFVVVDKEFNRIKMKSDVYLKMKFASEERTPAKVFQLVITEGYDDILPIIPDLKTDIDEFQGRIQKVKDYLANLWKDARNKYQEHDKNRKEYAAWVGKNVPSSKKSYYFTAIDNENPDAIYNGLVAKWCTMTAVNAYDRFQDIEKTIGEAN